MNSKATLRFKRAVVDRSPAYEGHKKTWESACGRYRIVWRDQAHGVSLTPKFLALALAKVTPQSPEFWSIISEHQKFSTALDACNQHARKDAEP